MNVGKILIAGAILTAIALFLVLDLGQYLTFEFLEGQQAAIEEFRRENTGLAVGAYSLVYVLVTALSLPGAAIMTLAGGAIFGLLWGTVIVSFASTIGATLAFLVARFLFRDSVQRRFGAHLAAVNEGVRREGGFYLFMLRLVPVFPFFVINLVMALTPMKTRTFFIVSQVGMLAGTIVYVNAGTQLAQIDSAAGILSPQLIGAFALLGVFPLVAKWTAGGIQRRRALRGWRKPKRFDRNLVVIGGGAAGLVTAYIAAAVKAKVTLVEKNEMGGDCLNTGCVPSKTLIQSAKLVHQVERHEEFGLAGARVKPDFGLAMQRVRRVIAAIEPHDSVERYQGLGVDVVKGEARITGPWSVEVDGRTLTTRHIVIATGARPFVPAIPGLDDVGYFTSDTIWSLEEHPGRLLVLGGGPVGSELSQAFQRLGAEVTQVEMMSRILNREDDEVSELIADTFRSEGVRVLAGHKATAFELHDGESVAILEHQGETVRVPFDTLLVAVGRQARVEGFGAEEVGVTVRNGRIETDPYLRTRVPTIFACGDCVGPYQFTHAASHQAWHAAVNSLFANPFKRFKVDYTYFPSATFTDPEVARVGLNEAEATAKGTEYELTRYDFAGQDRALTEEAALGFVKILTPPGKDRILGATIVGPSAGELISEVTLAMKHGIGLNKILSTIHPYPTLSEAIKSTAGEWKKAHAPQNALKFLERYHAWRIG